MAHYAFIDENNIVVEVIAGRDENDLPEGIASWEEYYSSKREGLTALRTSYNTIGGIHYNAETGEPSEDQSKAFRKNYAGIGSEYRPDLDAFVPPRPFDVDSAQNATSEEDVQYFTSWVLNEETCLWEPPTPYPSDENYYEWNETTQSWDLIALES